MPMSPEIFKTESIPLNHKNQMNGIMLLNNINNDVITACFFDPQYRGVMDKMNYGNEGARQKKRAMLEQMSDELIVEFIREISRILKPSGHLFLWVDKFHLCEGILPWLTHTEFEIVDMITWDKQKIGMGYRSRRRSEYLICLQKKPKKAKGVWTRHNIPDVWCEKQNAPNHPHQKPLELQKALIEAISNEDDIILDPAAGSFSVLVACEAMKRNFLGCDLSVDYFK